MKRLIMFAALVVTALGVVAGSASANSTGSITFESPHYTTGTINGQNGWSNTGCTTPT